MGSVSHIRTITNTNKYKFDDEVKEFTESWKGLADLEFHFQTTKIFFKIIQYSVLIIVRRKEN